MATLVGLKLRSENGRIERDVVVQDCTTMYNLHRVFQHCFYSQKDDDTIAGTPFTFCWNGQVIRGPKSTKLYNARNDSSANNGCDVGTTYTYEADDNTLYYVAVTGSTDGDAKYYVPRCTGAMGGRSCLDRINNKLLTRRFTASGAARGPKKPPKVWCCRGTSRSSIMASHMAAMQEPLMGYAVPPRPAHLPADRTPARTPHPRGTTVNAVRARVRAAGARTYAARAGATSSESDDSEGEAPAAVQWALPQPVLVPAAEVAAALAAGMPVCIATGGHWSAGQAGLAIAAAAGGGLNVAEPMGAQGALQEAPVQSAAARGPGAGGPAAGGPAAAAAAAQQGPTLAQQEAALRAMAQMQHQVLMQLLQRQQMMRQQSAWQKLQQQLYRQQQQLQQQQQKQQQEQEMEEGGSE